MESKPWDGKNYTRVVRTKPNDPRLHVRESTYLLHHVRSTGSGAINSDTHINPNWFDDNVLAQNRYQLVRNKAIGKVIEELTLFNNLFEAIYERQEAYKMLCSAGRGILLFLRNWRNPKYWRKVSRREPADLPSAWLMYNFGIKPLVQSVYDALNILGGDIPPFMVRGTSGTKMNDLVKVSSTYSGYTRLTQADVYFAFRVYIQPEVNPNLGLANILGLTTPFSTAFSVIPWGWAVDYFVNISEQLANFENRFPGVKIREVWETQTIKGTAVSTAYNKFVTNGTSVNSAKFIKMNRRASSLQQSLTFNFPLIGDNSAANLFSAIALTMKGKAK